MTIYGLTPGQEKVLDHVRDLARRQAERATAGTSTEPQPIDDERIFGEPTP